MEQRGRPGLDRPELRQFVNVKGTDIVKTILVDGIFVAATVIVLNRIISMYLDHRTHQRSQYNYDHHEELMKAAEEAARRRRNDTQK